VRNGGLDETVWTVLNGALELYRDSPRASAWLRQHMDRFAEPLRIAFAGGAKSGKSTLINAIVGERVAPVELSDSSQTFTWYQDGKAPRLTMHRPFGPTHEVPVHRRDRTLQVDRWLLEPPVERILVDWPARSLRGVTLIDTPAEVPPAGSAGIGTQPQDYGDGADILERASMEADGVVYLTRQVHGVDLDGLAGVRDSPVAAAMPVNTILVLSRADEVGGGRIDALSSAKQLAKRYRRNARVRGLCQTVIAIAGLIAQAGRTLRETEFEAMSALAAVPKTELEAALLSADRFVGTTFPAALDVDVRRGLLERFGIFGVRLTTTLIRQGCKTHPKLAAQLAQRGGLSDLREAIGRYFVDRREVLKARSALVALDVVLRMEPRPGAARLVSDLERLLCSAHEFRELRLLAALQVGRTTLPEGLHEEALRLVGGSGADIAARLGADGDVGEDEAREAVFDALARWQDQAENPMLDADQRAAARLVVRSCEGVLDATYQH
jgi:hypothetical protein